MRAKEIVAANTEGLSVLDWLVFTEHKECGLTLFESLDQKDTEYLDSLSLYSREPAFGGEFVPVFVMLFQNSRLTINSPFHLCKLKSTRMEDDLKIYVFVNDAGETYTYPSSRLSLLSYSRLFLFDTKDSFDKFRIAVTMKFGNLIPGVEFNES